MTDSPVVIFLDAIAEVFPIILLAAMLCGGFQCGVQVETSVDSEVSE